MRKLTAIAAATLTSAGLVFLLAPVGASAAAGGTVTGPVPAAASASPTSTNLPGQGGCC
ncbi:hypothetical protein [Kitasatospora sp. NBC_01539]|uniref:hypothetical protein n=1 Tax=Kitasatospora sp. NBC_01539 TaxID=2903577 RepID=UPI0038600AF1